MTRAWIGLWALVVMTLSCGGVVETPAGSASSSTGAGVLCTPGQPIACVCPGGGMGTQTCHEDGGGLDPCLGCNATSSTTTASSGSAGSTSSGEGGSASTASSGSGGASTTGGGGCMAGPDQDLDQDGFTITSGDCDDCNPLVNPAAIEIAGDGIDDDCDGAIDNLAPTCDQGLAVADSDPINAARAAELCKLSMGPKDWGVVSAKWVSPDGSAPPGNPSYALGHGLLTGLGPNVHVQAGKSLLALSTGTARQPTDAGYQPVSGFNKFSTDAFPMGFPKESPACPGIITGAPHDGVALEVSLRAPSNARGFSFDFNFFTYEWPGFSCSQYNDVFLALVSPIPAGLPDGNISFDPQGNLISANSTFIEVCGCQGGPPCQIGGQPVCTLGDAGLVGTGYQDQFQDHGSTGWLTSAASLTPNQSFTLRWTGYDSGDGLLDSTTLIDHWQWLVTPGVEVGTTRIQLPK